MNGSVHFSHDTAIGRKHLWTMFARRFNKFLATDFINNLSASDENTEFTNSVDPDEVAHDELSHLDLLCLSYSL